MVSEISKYLEDTDKDFLFTINKKFKEYKDKCLKRYGYNTKIKMSKLLKIKNNHKNYYSNNTNNI